MATGKGEQATIARMHALREEGLAYYRIVESLNAEGVPNAQSWPLACADGSADSDGSRGVTIRCVLHLREVRYVRKLAYLPAD